ncbi:hypothetical protein FRB93_011240 [Tulasnella sp. JGI-2019a]|nr:hypothetical protein FRB93_011240 [Tulasnella sp. JGI-2019a]
MSAFAPLRSSMLRSATHPPQISRLFPGLRRTSPPSPIPFLRSSRGFSSGIPSRATYVRFGDPPGGGGQKWRPFRDGKWDTPSKLLAGAVGAAGIYYVAHLERVEETGRWRFIDISVEAERKLGQQTDEEVMRTYGAKILPPNHPISKKVAKVASRIITAANLGEVKGVSSTSSADSPTDGYAWTGLPSGGADFGFDEGEWNSRKSSAKEHASVVDRLRQEWEVYVIKEDETPNAFVTGGGKIFVFTGILPVAGNDDGLATVLGHEIAHQVQRHVAEKASGMKVFTALVILLEVLGLDIGLSRVGLTLLMTLPNSRKVESEADNVGLRLMAQACYDPRQSVGLWERMSELEKKQGGGGWLDFSGDFLSTHPANQTRITTLQQWIPAALQVRAGASCTMADGQSIGDYYQSFRAFGL